MSKVLPTITAENYVEHVLQTEAPVTDELKARFDDTAKLDTFLRFLREFIFCGQVLDQYKKHFFYGRQINIVDFPPLTVDLTQALENLRETRNVRLLHGLLGSMTEAAEKAEILNDLLCTGKFDPVNLSEEIGDGNWYDGLLLDIIGMTPEQVFGQNIHKLLVKRYPGEFSEVAANNRDLVAERALLEQTMTAAPAA